VLGTNALLGRQSRKIFSISLSVSIDLRLLAFAAAPPAGGLCSSVFFLPTYPRIRKSPKRSERAACSSTGKRRRFARSAFVVAQLSLALCPSPGSGFADSQFYSPRRRPSGFDTAHLLTSSLPSAVQVRHGQIANGFLQQLLARIGAVPESALSPWRTIRR